MPDPMRIQENTIGPLGGATRIGIPSPTPGRQANGPAFSDVFKEALSNRPEALKFSAHAQTRLQSRQIDLNQADLGRIEGAVSKAASKGSRESLVLLDQTAFVVSVPNRTVITVVDKENLK